MQVFLIVDFLILFLILTFGKINEYDPIQKEVFDKFFSIWIIGNLLVVIVNIIFKVFF